MMNTNNEVQFDHNDIEFRVLQSMIEMGTTPNEKDLITYFINPLKNPFNRLLVMKQYEEVIGESHPEGSSVLDLFCISTEIQLVTLN